MRVTILVACLLVVAAAPVLAEDEPRWLAVVGGTLIDGTEGEPRSAVTIVVKNERIARIAPADEVVLPEGAKVIDASGKWVIPGLIDAHIHFFQSGSLYSRPDIIDLRAARPYAEEVAEARKKLPETFARYVASGITGVIDAGGPLWTFDVRTLASGIPRAPRVAVTGPLLGTEAPSALSALDDPPILRISSPAEAAEVVDRLLSYEPDLIKIWFVGSEADDVAPAWVSTVIAASHGAGVPIIAHATGLASARAMVEAGANVLAHSIDDASIDDGLMTMMKERGVVYTTTLVVDEGYREVFGRHVRLLDIERRLGDPEVIDTFDDFETLPKALIPDWVRQRPRQGVDAVMAANLVRVAAAGITIAAGSDAGNIGTIHGPSLHRELELMVEAGLTPAQVLVAATRGSAAAMGRLQDLGTVEAGKLADMVILNGDPTADITNSRKIDRVIKGGMVFDPAEIAAELKAAAD